MILGFRGVMWEGVMWVLFGVDGKEQISNHTFVIEEISAVLR
jgi:hypothetical protein